MTVHTIASIRAKAAELIRERGWCQWDYEGADKSLCVVAALRVAAGCKPDAELCEAAEPAINRMRQELHCGELLSLEDWNNNIASSADYVIAALLGKPKRRADK